MVHLPCRPIGGGGVALHPGDDHRLQAMAGQGAAGGTQAVLTEGILLVQHRDPVAAGPHQIVDDAIDFCLVTGPEVEHHRSERLPQQARAGEGGHQRDLCLLHQRQDRLHRRRADIAEQGEDPLRLDQSACVAQGQGRLVAIVEAHQSQLAAVDAAAAVHLLEPGHGPFAVVAAQLGGGPAEGSRLAEHKLGVAQRRRLLPARCRRGWARQQRDEQRDQQGRAASHP